MAMLSSAKSWFRFCDFNQAKVVLFACVLCAVCSGCIPSFVPLSDPKSVPAGPKVSDLIDNLKCELAEAKFNSKSEKPIFYGTDATKQSFLLSKQLAYIHYLATATLTLEVTNTQNFAPSFSFLNNFSTPMTNLTLAVGGQYMEGEHRNITLNMTIDFANLQAPVLPCGQGTELQGNLVLKEIIAMGLIAAAENTAAAVPPPPPAAAAGHLAPPPAANPTSPPTPKSPLSDRANSYPGGISAGSALGTFGTITDFTITEGASGGPNWTLTHFKGPGNNGSWLSLSRVVKDTLNITFVPLCKNSREKDAFDPAWSKWLDGCTPLSVETFSKAIGVGISNNTNQLLQSIQPLLTQ